MTPTLVCIRLLLYRAQVAEPVKTWFGSIPARSALLLQAEDSDGGTGWGEIWCNFPPHSAENKIRLMESVVAPLALGLPCHEPDETWHGLTARTRRWAIQCGEHGPIAACLAGLDLALWDLKARRRGMPLHVLLGAQPINSVRAYASGLNPDSALATIDRARSRGFRDFKVKAGFGLQQDLSVVDAICNELMPSERLMVDANQCWDMPQARQAVARLSERPLEWIEEPIPADSPAEDWAELAMLSTTKLAGGENVSSMTAFAKLITQGSHRIVQPDMLKWGGVTGSLAVGRAAQARGLSYCPHWLGSGLGLMAAAQVMAATGSDGMLEHDVMENPLREPMGAPFPRVAQGLFPVSQAPGIGVTPDLRELQQWLVHEQAFSKATR